MPTYIGLFNFTHQGIANVKDSPARLDAAREMLGGLDVTIKDFFLTMGQYDIVAIVEAPDDTAMARAALMNGMAGNVTTETLRAFTEDEYRGIVGSL